MKKKPITRSAFFNPRFLISFAICALCVIAALFAFTHSPGGNARAAESEQSQLQVSDEAVLTDPADPDQCFLFWNPGPVYPIAVLDNAVTSVGGNLYSFAGVSTTIVTNAYKFDGTTWTPIAPMPAGLEYPAATTDGTDIYLLGGALTGTGTPQNTLYKYNVAANTYTPLAPFTTGTWNHGAAFLNGKIYKFAGTGPATASTNVLEIYDVASNTWSAGAPYPLAISFASAIAQGNFIYGAGGIQSVGSAVSSKTFRYDPITNTWDDAAIADLPATRWGAASGFFNGGWVMAGGYVAGAATANISNTAVSWDPGTNTWSTLPTKLGERSRMNGAVLNGTFYVIGGRSMASAAFVGTNDNQALICSATTPTPSPTPCPAVFSDNFDGVTAPTLPAGWVATNVAGADPVLWVTSTTTPDTAPNNAFINDPATVNDKVLDTPGIFVGSTSATISFRNFFNTESTFDGCVLEVSSPSIGGGAFTDITNVAVGGSFVTGGYTGPISTAFMSPIAGRQAWSGTSGTYLNTVANLGPNVAGQTIKLRFRMASDSSVSATGWRIDGVAVRDCNSGPSPTPCVGCTPTPTPVATATPTPPGPTPTPGGPTPTPCSGSTSEGFTDITTLVPGGWFMQNNSQPGPGLTGWFQGNTAVFNAQGGAPTSYIGTNFNNGTGTSTLSNWLLTPVQTLQNGVVLSFWTRTTDTPTFPDRLQVRMSTNGASIDVGTTATSVGDFTALLLDINPTYTTSGYPNVWTQFTVTLSGIASPTSGRLALRYFVENGGPSGVNSDFIGIDTLTITGSCGPTPTPCAGCTPTPPPTPSPTPTPQGPTPTPGCGVNENFDGVTAPALPAGWVAANAAGAAPLWVTSSTTPDSAPNSAFIDDPATVSDKRLDTPNISITGAAQITFRNNFALEPVAGGTFFFDGGVLEVSSPNIAGGAFTDVTNAAVGGSFVTGGYTGTISTAFSSPIGGRMAWSQSSAGYITTTANLGPNVIGQTIKLRFRMCSDSSVSGTGWRIDNVVVTGGPCVTPTPCPGCTPTPTVSPTPTPPIGPTPTPCSGSTSEGFTDITTLVPGGWFMQNNSQPGPGLTGWFQGNTAVFDAQAGAPTSYIGTNFNNGTGTSTLSNWLLTPPLTLQNGVVLSFWTRTTDTPTFPDRLQVRMSTNGASTNVGTTATSVGDFTAVLLDINPTYTTSGYPNVWTQFTVTLSGIASPTSGRLALRYFVENGGPSGVNSDFIGIDTLTINGACGPTPTPPGPTPSLTPSPSPTVSPTPTPESPTPTVSPTPGGETPTPTPGGETPTPTPVGETHALNLSTRLQVGTDSNVGIGGFIVTGTGDRNVLLRGIGPSLPGGINALPDPVLELHGENGFVTVINNNWRDNQEQAIEDTGIPPTNDLESAILVMLPPGAYTAILKGNGTTNNTGVGLVEIYDLTQGGSSKLGNISTRGFVQTGNDVMIAGFILGAGNTSDPIIVRGIGPSLADFGISGVLADPTLELRDENGALVNSNNDWMDDPDQVALINAAGLAPTNALESAIAATLVPGSYTAVLAGNGGGTGTGLVEMYDRPTASATPTPGGETPTPTPPEGPTPTPPIGPTATPVPPTPTPGVTVCTENFDGVTAPALPAGWVASNPVAGDGVMFVTTTNVSDTAPNNAFIPDQDDISDKVLDRQMTINSASPVLTFRNNFNTEFSDGIFWDGSVLEISTPSISGGEFLDVTDSHVGGSFTSGGYTGEISGDASNPLAGRMAWSGNSGGYIDTVLNMGPNLNGQTVTLRFRFGTDEAEPGTGWHIDGLSINGASCP